MPNLTPYSLSVPQTTLQTPTISLKVLPYGLTFSSLQVKLDPSSEETRDLLIGPADLEQHVKHRRFLNQTVGRYANRLPSGQVSYDEDEHHQLDLPSNEGQDVCLHGGLEGIDTFDWTMTEEFGTGMSETLKGSESNHQKFMRFRYRSPAGSDGFPCDLVIEAKIAVKERDDKDAKDVLGRIEVILNARIADDCPCPATLTPVNLTVHWGFNCGSFDGKEAEHVLDHEMYINADRTPELDSNMLATGKVITLDSDSPLNFTRPRKIGSNFPENGVDHNLIFASTQTTEPQVILTSPDRKVSLEFQTSEASVQCYTAAGFDGIAPSKKENHDPAKEGKGYPKYGAAFLEFHQPLATFLHDDLKKIVGHDTLLRKGEVYENWCEITIKTPLSK